MPNDFNLYELIPVPFKKAYRYMSWYKNYEKDDFPFAAVHIETQGNCNRSCEYCAVAVLDKRTGRMPDDVFIGIIDQLKEFNFDRILAFHFLNEPLLDKRIYEFLKIARQKLPAATLQMVTNGDLLDLEKVKLLFNECGIDKLLISSHDEAAHDRFHDLFGQLDDPIKQHVSTKEPFSRVAESDNAIMTFGGAVQDLDDKYNVVFVPRSGCDKREFTIDYEGNVHACCIDALGEYIIGNVLKDSVLDIAKSAKKQIKGHFTGNYTSKSCFRCVGDPVDS